MVERARARRHPVRGRRPGRGRLAARAPAARCRFCRRGAGEPLPRTDASPAGTPTAGTPSAAVVAEAFAYALPASLSDDDGGAAAVRGDHRLPRAAAGRAAAGRRAGHLRVRRRRAHLAAQVALRPGRHGARADPGRGRPAARPRPRLRLRRGRAATSRRSRWTGAVLFAPAGELVPVALRALDRGGTLAVAGIHLSPRSRRWTTTPRCSRSGSCAASPPTPGATARSSFCSPSGWACARRRSRTRWPMHPAPSPTSRTAGSPGPRCCTPDVPARYGTPPRAPLDCSAAPRRS